VVVEVDGAVNVSATLSLTLSTAGFDGRPVNRFDKR
jgi:hypothetical protein